MSHPAVSTDGARVAFIAGHDYLDEEVLVWEPASDTLTNLTQSFGREKTFARLVWSPDSRMLAVPMCGLPCVEHTLSLFDVRTGERHDLATSPSLPELAFSGDGKLLAYVTDHGSGELWVVPTAGGPLESSLPSGSTRSRASRSADCARARESSTSLAGSWPTARSTLPLWMTRERSRSQTTGAT